MASRCEARTGKPASSVFRNRPRSSARNTPLTRNCANAGSANSKLNGVIAGDALQRLAQRLVAEGQLALAPRRQCAGHRRGRRQHAPGIVSGTLAGHQFGIAIHRMHGNAALEDFHLHATRTDIYIEAGAQVGDPAAACGDFERPRVVMRDDKMGGTTLQLGAAATMADTHNGFAVRVELDLGAIRQHQGPELPARGRQRFRYAVPPARALPRDERRKYGERKQREYGRAIVATRCRTDSRGRRTQLPGHRPCARHALVRLPILFRRGQPRGKARLVRGRPIARMARDAPADGFLLARTEIRIGHGETRKGVSAYPTTRRPRKSWTGVSSTSAGEPDEAMPQCPLDVALDGLGTNAQPLRDFPMRQAVEAIQQEGPPALVRQLIEHGGKPLGLATMFGDRIRSRHRASDVRQFAPLEVSCLALLVPPVIDRQIRRRCKQDGTRLAPGARIAVFAQLEPGVLQHIRRILRADAPDHEGSKVVSRFGEQAGQQVEIGGRHDRTKDVVPGAEMVTARRVCPVRPIDAPTPQAKVTTVAARLLPPSAT